MTDPYIRWFRDLGLDDVPAVGGKNASLGELTRLFRHEPLGVPHGFAVTVSGYWRFLGHSRLREPIAQLIAAHRSGGTSVDDTARDIRDRIVGAQFPADLREAIVAAYRDLPAKAAAGPPGVAVRSSATAEDLPAASFAGQQDSFLGVYGEDALLDAVRKCYASLFTARAMAYREKHGFDHMKVGLSAGIHELVAWPECAAAGTIFTIDPDSGFPNVIVVHATVGLGESIVLGHVRPDEFLIFKPTLDSAPDPILARHAGDTGARISPRPAPRPNQRDPATAIPERTILALEDSEVLAFAHWARMVERHYGRPMDLEWAVEGGTRKPFIIQARPETVHGPHAGTSLRTYRIIEPPQPIAQGHSVGVGVGTGRANILDDPRDDSRFAIGDVLVARMTSPDWVPLMRRASALVTDEGGRTSHAAIVSRELGLPAVVGTGHATAIIDAGSDVTVSCAAGATGYVYPGRVRVEVSDVDIAALPATTTRVMLNLAVPDAAFARWRLPADGVGLTRIEFIIGDQVGIHPLALLHPEQLDPATREEVAKRTARFDEPSRFFVDRLAEGIALIAASRHPHPVIVRFSDFKTNEYANLLGGSAFEPVEENPMLGWRGASRYYHPRYREAFALECEAIRKVRERMGLDNVAVMIPFCRTVDEARRVLEEMRANGLERGTDRLKVYLMCEIPSNVVLADRFAPLVDGFSIGSNDLTQLVLGVDRDSAELTGTFDEHDEAVRRMIRSVITVAHEHGTTVGLCGQAPSDDPSFAAFLVECGIDSISVNPDSFVAVKQAVAAAEARLAARAPE